MSRCSLKLIALLLFLGAMAAFGSTAHGAEKVSPEIASRVLSILTESEEDPDGTRRELVIAAGQAAINPPGVWHTAKVGEPTTALFITAGEGTLNEVRD